MISRVEFAKIEVEVIDSLNEVFDYIKTKCQDHNYVLFLAEADFKEEYQRTYHQHKLSPYVIDNRMDRYKDETRLKFFIQYLQTFYSWPSPLIQTQDDDFQITLELMVYTHIWESKPYLRQLHRLALLVKGQSYPWDVTVPEMSKHTFIRVDTRDVFKTKKLKIASVISKGFLTCLRNAFAHSEYRFDEDNQCIYLDTYKGAWWDIDRISYNDWSRRFVYSALLCYYFLEIFYHKRKSLPFDFGRKTFTVIHPINPKKFRALDIHYDLERDNFSFYRF